MQPVDSRKWPAGEAETAARRRPMTQAGSRGSRGRKIAEERSQRAGAAKHGRKTAAQGRLDRRLHELRVQREKNPTALIPC
jgi:hypothetical protein